METQRARTSENFTVAFCLIKEFFPGECGKTGRVCMKNGNLITSDTKIAHAIREDKGAIALQCE